MPPTLLARRFDSSQKWRASKAGRVCPCTPADRSADVPSSPLLHRQSRRVGRAATKPAFGSTTLIRSIQLWKAFQGQPGGTPARPKTWPSIGDKWGLQRQKISFNALWRASNKVGWGFFSSQERMVSIILKYFWKAYRILNRFWSNSLHTYTSTCVPRGSGFVVVVLGFTSWRRDLDLSSDVCHVNRVFINPAAWYKTWFSKLYYEFIMKDLLWDCVSSAWPVILMDVVAPSRDTQSKSAQKWAGRASQDSTVAGTVMR